MIKKAAGVALIIVGIGVIGFSFWSRYQPMMTSTAAKTSSLAQSVVSQLTASPVPSPFPFQEMTIPYLRRQSFESQLGEKRQVGKNSNYTSYLTSYTSDGLRIDGLLTEPVGEPPEGGWPAIVFIHGYIPPTQYKTQEKYVEYVNYLARNGFAVFKIDLRGHGSSEGEAGGAYYSSDYVIDALNAYSALQKAENVNPQKVGFWGHSMAGNIVMRALASKTDVPAAVIWAGAGYSYEDLQEFGIDDNSYRPPSLTSERQRKRQQLYDAHGQFDPESPFWSQVVPTNYLKDMKSAIQLHHAENDDVVGVEYSQNLSQLLEEAGIVHELHEYKQGGHNITNPSFTPAMQRTVEFFKAKL
jgi:dipeptidyl aminopeptidase/acylaminoacyl peptidase